MEGKDHVEDVDDHKLCMDLGLGSAQDEDELTKDEMGREEEDDEGGDEGEMDMGTDTGVDLGVDIDDEDLGWG